MMRKHSLFLLLSLFLLFSAAGCSDDSGAGLRIEKWNYAWDTLVAGSQGTITVILSAAVVEKTYVDITNNFTNFVITEPAPPDSLVFKEGEQKKNVIVQAKDLAHDGITLTFTIRGGHSRDFKFKIELPFYPDAGLKKDKGSPPKDTSVVDQGAPDQGEADGGDTKDMTAD